MCSLLHTFTKHSHWDRWWGWKGKRKKLNLGVARGGREPIIESLGLDNVVYVVQVVQVGSYIIRAAVVLGLYITSLEISLTSMWKFPISKTSISARNWYNYIVANIVFRGNTIFEGKGFVVIDGQVVWMSVIGRRTIGSVVRIVESKDKVRHMETIP